MNHPIKRLQPILNQHGIKGLIDSLDGGKHSLLIRVLLAADKRVLGMVQFARDWVHFEGQLDSKSGPEVARDFIDYLALDLQVNQSPTPLSQTGRPAILLGLDHDAIVEPIVLASLLCRNDIRILGMKVFQYLGPGIAEYILPVLPKKVAVDYQGNRKSSLSNLLDPIYQLYRLENQTTEEIGQLNRISIQQSADHVSAGGVLIVFPKGGQQNHRHWFRGVGEILSLLPPDILSSTPIYPVATAGLSRKLFYQKVHQAVFMRPRPTPVQVSVYDPVYIPPRLVDLSPEKLLDYLKAQSMDHPVLAKDGQGVANYGQDLDSAEIDERKPTPQSPTS